MTQAAANPPADVPSPAKPQDGPEGATARILVVEDQPTERAALMKLLRAQGHEVMGCESADKALGYVEEDIDVVLADLYLGEVSGIDLVSLWKNRRSETQFIVITGNSSIETAVEAMKKGAFNYLTKPLDFDALLVYVEKALAAVQKDRELDSLRRRLDDRFGMEQIVGDSKQMRDVLARVQRAAPVDSTVLILGESGTGKELVAQALHQNSKRKDKPFVAINIAAVPDTLVESELFGHVKGAFTGAMDKRMGRFEQASGGTLFIDEVGDFGVDLQAKLLRVLETMTVTPVGGHEDKRVDVRIVAATSRDLRQRIREGKFREDLFYRLNVIPINLPPLRERPDDLPPLVEHFLRDVAAKKGVTARTVSPEVMRTLIGYRWPGNVRELRNTLETMLVMADGEQLQAGDVPEQLRADAPAEDAGGGGGDHQIPAGLTMEELERLAIETALADSDGNRTHAANRLGISVRTLQRKLRQYELEKRTRG